MKRRKYFNLCMQESVKLDFLKSVLDSIQGKNDKYITPYYEKVLRLAIAYKSGVR